MDSSSICSRGKAAAMCRDYEKANVDGSSKRGNAKDLADGRTTQDQGIDIMNNHSTSGKGRTSHNKASGVCQENAKTDSSSARGTAKGAVDEASNPVREKANIDSSSTRRKVKAPSASQEIQESERAILGNKVNRGRGKATACKVLLPVQEKANASGSSTHGKTKALIDSQQSQDQEISIIDNSSTRRKGKATVGKAETPGQEQPATDGSSTDGKTKALVDNQKMQDPEKATMANSSTSGKGKAAADKTTIPGQEHDNKDSSSTRGRGNANVKNPNTKDDQKQSNADKTSGRGREKAGADGSSLHDQDESIRGTSSKPGRGKTIVKSPSVEERSNSGNARESVLDSRLVMATAAEDVTFGNYARKPTTKKQSEKSFVSEKTPQSSHDEAKLKSKRKQQPTEATLHRMQPTHSDVVVEFPSKNECLPQDTKILDDRLHPRVNHLRLERKQIRTNSKVFNKIRDIVIRHLRENNGLSKWLSKSINSGSYYEKTKVTFLLSVWRYWISEFLTFYI